VAITDKIILIGGGEHARVVLDCLLSSGHPVAGLFDPKYSDELFGVPQRGAYHADVEPGALAIIAIGNNRVRQQVALETKHVFTNAIHQSVLLSPFARIGTGTMILHGAIVQAKTRVGNHVIINTGAQVDHDCLIEDYVHLGPGVILCGTIHIGEGTFIGAGTTVIPGKRIGKWSVIGAGSVVIEDVPDFSLAVGNPARIIKKINHE
jgi:sugar O-acyltransferase (sialic acid O-acetyltransferase NeuD family)